MNFNELWALWISPHASALPAPALAALWMHLGWGFILAVPLLAVLNALGNKWLPAVRHGKLPAMVAIIAWCLLPGDISPAYWLGLAFQSPSVLTVMLCLFILAQSLAKADPRAAVPAAHNRLRKILPLAAGILLGWILMLDTLALLPTQFYIRGWSAAAVTATVFVSALLFWLCSKPGEAQPKRLWALPLGLLIFVVLRLPNGNVWDALLDPILWIALHIYALSALLPKRQAGIMA